MTGLDRDRRAVETPPSRPDRKPKPAKPPEALYLLLADLALYKARLELSTLRKERKKSKIGFESQKVAEPIETPVLPTPPNPNLAAEPPMGPAVPCGRRRPPHTAA